MANYKNLFVLALLLTMISLSPQPASSAEVRISHAILGNSTIQAAINDANPGDTIILESGIYHEELIVGRPITLKGLDTGKGRPIIAPDGGRIILAAQGLNINGFDLFVPINESMGNCSMEVVLPATIYLNNFFSKTNICSEDMASWNSSQPINYQFNSRVLRSRLGNYWADYSGKDGNEDGIGDEPYFLNSNNVDFFPLMQPVDNYVIPGEKETKEELILAKVNETFTISIPSNPTTGNDWVADYDYVLLDLERSGIESGPSEAIGARGTSVFVFKPKGQGLTTISFVYKRSWENIVADVRIFHVEISA